MFLLIALALLSCVQKAKIKCTFTYRSFDGMYLVTGSTSPVKHEQMNKLENKMKGKNVLHHPEFLEGREWFNKRAYKLTKQSCMNLITSFEIGFNLEN